MRPVIEKQGFKPRHVMYIILAIICVIAIGIAVYIQFFKDEKIGVIFGITEEEDEEYDSLKENFINIFDNEIDIEEAYTVDIEKIRENEEIIFVAYNIYEQNEQYTLQIQVPYFNISSDITREFNRDIRDTFEEKSESIINSSDETNIIYTVKYKAYVHENIVSLVILSEIKEGENNQQISIKTYNYNLAEDKKVEINDLLNLKGISQSQANSEIKEEIEKTQKQNTKLAELGYNTSIRDSSDDMYKVENAEQFFLGQNGYIYIVYPYGNTEFTSEMDIVIFR